MIPRAHLHRGAAWRHAIDVLFVAAVISAIAALVHYAPTLPIPI